MFKHWWTILALAFTIGVTSAAVASDGDDEDDRDLGKRSVLLFGPGGSNADGMMANGYVRERLPMSERPKQRVSVTGLPFPTERPIWMTGTADTSWCQAGTTPPGSRETVLGRAREATGLLETSRIFDVVDRGERSAACAPEIVDPTMLAELYLLRGLAQHVEQQPDLAAAYFARAAGIDASLEWDTGYPPEPQQTYLSAKEAVIQERPFQLGWMLPNSPGLEVFVDGRPLASSTLKALPPVPHVIQLKDSDGAVTGIIVAPTPGDVAVLVDRDAAAASLMAGPANPLHSVVLSTVLGAVADQWSADAIVVVDNTYRPELSEPLVYRYRPDNGAFETLTAMKTVHRRSPRYADRIRIALGTGLIGESGDDALGVHLGLCPHISGSLRIGPGFEPGLSVDTILHNLDQIGSGKWVVTPQVRGHVGYRWHPRFVQTFVGAGLNLRFNGPLKAQTDFDGNAVTYGAEVIVNMDIVSPKLPGFFLRVGGSLGNAGPTATYIRGDLLIGFSI